MRTSGSITIVLLVGLGIGIWMSALALIQATLLENPPFPDAQRLYLVRKQAPDGGQVVFDAEFAAWAAAARPVADLAAYSFVRQATTGREQVERLRVARVTAGVFPVFGLRVDAGRPFSADDARVGGEPVAIISAALRDRLFGEQVQPLGATLTLDHTAHRIVGVAPRLRFPMDARADVLIPWRLSDTPPVGRPVLFVSGIVARLVEGATPEHLTALLKTLDRQLLTAAPPTLRSAVDSASISAEPLKKALSARAERPLKVVALATVALLLVACANIASLQVARTLALQPMIAIRLALGASRWRVVREFLAESVVLGALGWCGALLIAIIGVTLLPRALDLAWYGFAMPAVDWTVAGGGACLALFCTVLCSVVPLAAAARLDLGAHLRPGEGQTGATRRTNRTHAGLVGVQIALAVVLANGSGLLWLSYHRLSTAPTGFERQGVLTGGVLLPRSTYPDAARQRVFAEHVALAVASMPGVRGAALAGALPMAVATRTPLDVSGAPGIVRAEAILDVVSPTYFETLGVPLRWGRMLTAADTEGAPRVAVVNESLVRQATGSMDASLLRVRLPGDTWMSVVGVVGDVRPLGVGSRADPRLYLALAQSPVSQLVLFVAAPSRSVSARQMRAAVAAVDKQVPLSDVSSLDTLVGRALASERLGALFAGLLAGLTLSMAMSGVYGLATYVAGRRRREIAIRLAIGARPADLLWRELVRAAGQATVPIAIGLGLAVATNRMLASWLYGVSPGDPRWLGVVGLAILVTTMLSLLLPIARVSRVNPTTMLRYS